jgi:short-subunit dehydrogenase
VTGASRGIGLEIARQFATNGYDLLVVASDARIGRAAADLAADATLVDSLRVDLSARGGVETLYRTIQSMERPVDALAIDAGIGLEVSTLEDELRLLDLDIRSTVQLARLVAKDMVARRRGRIAFATSASKPIVTAAQAFILSFSEMMGNELTGTGVTVTTILPGPAREHAKTAFDAMMAGRAHATPERTSASMHRSM